MSAKDRSDWGSEYLKPLMRDLRIGTKAERAIGFVPFAKKLPCYDDHGNLKLESKCGKRKRKWDGE